MAGTVSVELTPSRMEVEPGGAPVELTVGLRNLGSVVSQFTVEVADLEPDWYSIAAPTVGLFPQDGDAVRVSFHPPKSKNLRAGEYPFRVLVRGRGGVQEQSSQGVLDVQGVAVFRLDIEPRKITDRGHGDFRLVITNSGTADVALAIEGRDEEDACSIAFPKGESTVVEAGTRRTVPLRVKAKKRPWVGADHPYGFSLTARPTLGRGSPQTLSGQFVHRAYLQSWAPVVTLLRYMGIALAILAIAWVILYTSIGEVLRQRSRAILQPACVATIGRIPVLGYSICSALTMAIPLNVGDTVGAKSTSAKPATKGPSPAGPGGTSSEATPSNCDFQNGFLEFSAKFPLLLGNCTSTVSYDSFGNAYQSTDHGMLLWYKFSNLIYFDSSSIRYQFLDNYVQVIDALPPDLALNAGRLQPTGSSNGVPATGAK